MQGTIRYVKSLFKKYDSGYEYWVRLKDIKINPEWRETKIGQAKWNRKLSHYQKTGTFQSRIILEKDTFELVDGYSSFLIAESMGIKKVPVYFK